jgi:thiamine-phosphate pyrophosphorylase
MGWSYNRPVVASDMNGAVLRLIDANANRAREALRVMEDYARFVLDSPQLCGQLKSLRHDLSQILRSWVTDAIIHRDTPGDVGTNIKTPAEETRTDMADVVTAAGKRLGEALRALDEFLKIACPADAIKIESIRYRFYEIEQKLALTLRPATRFAPVKLYVLISESACKIPWLAAAEAALDGGADCLQLREKSIGERELLSRARQLTDLCHQRGALCIINDRPDIAVLAGADGVHLGQDDLPAPLARRIVGNRAVIGISTHHLDQARAAILDGADYIGVGPIYKSPTKPRDFVVGLEYAATVAHLPIRKVAIAGIGLENVDDVLATGIRAIAVTAAVLGCQDVRGAARSLKEKLCGKVRSMNGE